MKTYKSFREYSVGCNIPMRSPRIPASAREAAEEYCKLTPRQQYDSSPLEVKTSYYNVTFSWSFHSTKPDCYFGTTTTIYNGFWTLTSIEGA